MSHFKHILKSFKHLWPILNKGDVYLEAGYGVLSPFFIFSVQMTWKIDIVEGLDASLWYQSFKAQLQYFASQF